MGRLYIVLAVLLLVLSGPSVFAARLPEVGSDTDTWGTVLNEYLQAEHGPNGTHTNVTAESVTVSSRFCISSDCRTVWPAGGGNLTGVGALNYVANFFNASFLTTGSLIDNGLYFHFRYGNGTQINTTDLFIAGINITQRLAADNSTQDALISSLTTLQAADNATQATLINFRANQSDLAANSTRLESLYTIQTADNTTIANNLTDLWSRVFTNNATISASMVTLGGENNFTARWNYFANVSMVRLNTTDIFTAQLGNLSDYIVSNNATIAANLTDLNSRIVNLATLQAADNSTIANNLSSLNTRINNQIVLEAADNSTQATLISNLDTKEAADNATQSALISSLTTLQAADNATISANLSSLASILYGKATGSDLSKANQSDFQYVNTTQIADNSTQAGQISNEVTLQAANNATQSTLISSLTTQQVADNTTTSSRIGNVITTYANLSAVNTFTAAWNMFINANFTQLNATDVLVSGVNILQRTNADNSTQAALISSLTTLQAADNATIATNLSSLNVRINNAVALQAADNTTIANNLTDLSGRIFTNNATIAGTAAFLYAENNFTARWNYFTNVSMIRLNITDIFTAQLGNLSDYIVSNNATIANNLSSLNTRINNQIIIQAADNTTIANNLSSLNTRINNQIVLEAADNSTQSALISSLTTLQTADNATIATNLSSLNTRINNQISIQAADNATIANNLTDLNSRIVSLDTKETSDNSTQSALITANNNTLTGILATKYNNSGGILSGYMNISIIDSSNATAPDALILSHSGGAGNTSAGVSLLFKAFDNNTESENLARISSIFTNANNASETSVLIFYVRVLGGVLTERMRITEDGTILFGTRNITGEIDILNSSQRADNTTIANNLSSLNTRINNAVALQAADNTTIANNLSSLNTRINNIVALQTADNTTIANNLSSLHTLFYTLTLLQIADNTTIANNLSSLASILYGKATVTYVDSGLSGKLNLSTTTVACPTGTVVQNVTVTNGVPTTNCVADQTSLPGGDLSKANQSDFQYVNTTQIADNVTIANNLSSLNDRINNEVALQAANNATQANALSGKLNITGPTFVNLPYGSMWAYNTTNITVVIGAQNVYVNITNFTSLYNYGFVFNSNNTLQANFSGIYKIDYSVSIIGLPGADYGLTAGINGINQNNTYSHVNTTSDAIFNAGAAGILSLNVGDNVTLMITDEEGTVQNAQIRAANVAIVRIGI